LDEEKIWEVVADPETKQDVHLIEPEPLPEPEDEPEVILNPADTYAEGVDAIPGTNKMLLIEPDEERQ